MTAWDKLMTAIMAACRSPIPGDKDWWWAFRPARCWCNWRVPRRPADARIKSCSSTPPPPACPRRRRNRSITNSDPTQRLIYVGSQTIPSGGGAIELNVPTASWLIYGYQWPEASRANVSTNAIILRQGGAEVQRITFTRTDGVNGDTNYNPLFPFKMRGSVDQYGNVIGGVHVSNLTYAIDIPVVTNAPFDILVRSDASCVNTLVKLDGGMDLNSQMGLGPTSVTGFAPTNFLDLRDNPARLRG